MDDFLVFPATQISSGMVVELGINHILFLQYLGAHLAILRSLGSTSDATGTILFGSARTSDTWNICGITN